MAAGAHHYSTTHSTVAILLWNRIWNKHIGTGFTFPFDKLRSTIRLCLSTNTHLTRHTMRNIDSVT